MNTHHLQAESQSQPLRDFNGALWRVGFRQCDVNPEPPVHHLHHRSTIFGRTAIYVMTDGREFYGQTATEFVRLFPVQPHPQIQA